jgi:hypothetical protein
MNWLTYKRYVRRQTIVLIEAIRPDERSICLLIRTSAPGLLRSVPLRVPCILQDISHECFTFSLAEGPGVSNSNI